MKILLTGASGQLGWELRRTLAPLGNVLTLTRQQLDLAQPESLRSAVTALAPDLIVNPAAYTAVDRAESDAALAEAVNADAPRELAQIAAQRGIPLVHFSTDYVFDGTQSTPYSESDLPNPLGVYGASKRAGELAVQAAGGSHLILRTSWVYGLRGNNFLRTMQRLARERESLSVVNDQWGAPTWSRLLAEATALVVARWLMHADRAATSGVYHLSCGGRTNWHEFAAAILEDLRRRGERVATLAAIPTTSYPTAAVRPAQSLLDNTLIAETFGVRLPDWETALALCLEQDLLQ
ncbi:MAG: dTDP-4-dehydrorhamnose reductase [Thiobacillus sp.]